MSELRTKQSLFAVMVAQLIYKAQGMGYEVTLGEAWRDPEWAGILADRKKGLRNSLHCDRLAIDLNLFRHGEYLTAAEDYEPLGTWWKAIGGSYGGDFGDHDHFSLAWGGRR
jgi:hypothetical protein